MKLQVHAYTEKGPRKANEDHVLIGRMVRNSGHLGLTLAQDDEWLQRYGLLCAVADGVGGEVGGATASYLALTTLESHFHASTRTAEVENAHADSLLAAAARANETLLTVQQQRPELARMGCTLAGVCLTPAGYVVFSAGDSRVYRVRDGLAKELTVDDTVTNAQMHAGSITPEEAATSPERHTLLNLLGSASFRLRVKAGPEFREGDRLLICSDGIHDPLTFEAIEQALAGLNRGERGVTALAAAALGAGGKDNLSIILIELGDGAVPAPEPARAAVATPPPLPPPPPPPPPLPTSPAP